ncbi:MAG: (2Fe-2S)-binding protein [Caldisericaceae bacterium]|nr:(2Fe-2S)-binding protein [Caldisericaceae bacterium]
MKKTVRIKINGKTYEAEEGESILSVCNRENIDIPNLCFNEALAPYGACRLCMVEVVNGPGKKGMTTSCTLEAVEGLEVVTDTEQIVKYRNVLFELYLAQAPNSEEIKEMAAKYGVTKTRFAKKAKPLDPLGNKCVLCGQCVRVCDEIMGTAAINYIGRGFHTKINTPYLEKNDACMGCGACAEVCPTGAIQMEDIYDKRIMKSWSGTEVKLKKCKSCGRYFAPEPIAEFAYAKLDPEIKEELKDLCPDCRRKLLSRKEILISQGEVSKNED